MMGRMDMNARFRTQAGRPQVLSEPAPEPKPELEPDPEPFDYGAGPRAPAPSSDAQGMRPRSRPAPTEPPTTPARRPCSARRGRRSSRAYATARDQRKGDPGPARERQAAAHLADCERREAGEAMRLAAAEDALQEAIHEHVDEWPAEVAKRRAALDTEAERALDELEQVEARRSDVRALAVWLGEFRLTGEERRVARFDLVARPEPRPWISGHVLALEVRDALNQVSDDVPAGGDTRCARNTRPSRSAYAPGFAVDRERERDERIDHAGSLERPAPGVGTPVGGRYGHKLADRADAEPAPVPRPPRSARRDRRRLAVGRAARV
jgi:hypothetical protein